MDRKHLILAGLMLTSLAALTPAGAVNLSKQTIGGIQQSAKPAIAGDAVIQKSSPAKKIPLNRAQACPKLFAKGLRVVRVVPQPARGGVQTYRFILDGNIANRGATGVANAGLNVTQSVQGKPGKRIALKLFKKQVNKKQVLNVSRDLRVTIQSDELSRAQVSHTVFKMNVTNMRNAQGACGDYSPTVSTLSAAQLSRALPTPVRGVSQQAGVIPPVARPPARLGFAAPALPAKRSLKTQKPAPGLNQPPLATIKTGRPVPKVHPVIPGKRGSAQTKAVTPPSFSLKRMGKQKPPVKPAQGFGLAPQAITKKPVKGRGGFAPKAAVGSFGLNKPVTATGGKSFLPPAATAGSRHVLSDDVPRPRIGGFAPLAGVNTNVAHTPITGSGGASLLPAGAPQMKLTLKSVHRVNDRSDDFPANIVGRGDRVVAVFDITNLGSATGRVKVGRIGRPLFITDEILTLAPGHTGNLQLEVPVTNGNYAEGAWKAVFGLMTATNQEYHDSNIADNYVTASMSFDTWSGDIAVEKIEEAKITMSTNVSDSFYGSQRIPWISESWQGTGYETPKMLTLLVKVKNYDFRESAPQQLTVFVKGLVEYVSPRVRGNSHYPERYSKTFNCSGASCPMRVTVNVPSLGAGVSRSIPVTFSNVGYKLWVNDKAGNDGAEGSAHAIRPGGYYMCKDNRGAASLARIQVMATLDTHDDARPSNNGLRQSFLIDTWRGSGCQVLATGHSQAFIP